MNVKMFINKSKTCYLVGLIILYNFLMGKFCRIFMLLLKICQAKLNTALTVKV